jgi:predicted small lipoprotein YifL
MQRSPVVKIVARAVIVATLLMTIGAGIAACGQRGPLYLPDKENPDKRR